ncbi:MAG: inositol monophosphatase family protein, partial [Halobacteria archaeon]|nr:inositol monophosphatase family protein [Halobacteria archaeon]
MNDHANDYEYLDTAIEAAKSAGEIQRERFRELKHDDVSYKGSRDLVTQVDIECEKAIKEKIRNNHPRHAVLGEETGETRNEKATSDHRWIVDPLDGTTNFVH